MADSTSTNNETSVDESLSTMIRHEIRKEFQSRVDELMETVRGVIKSETAQLFSKQPADSSQDVETAENHPGLSDQMASGQKAALQATIDELMTKNISLTEANEKLQQSINDSNLLAATKIREAEQKSKKLHKIILESGLSQSGPIDEEVAKSFSFLKNRILQLVKKFCTRHDAIVRSKLYQMLAPEYKDFFVIGLVATKLWQLFFHPEILLFGFDGEADSRLGQFEGNLRKSNAVSLSDIVDWRIRTVELAKQYDPEGSMGKPAIEAAASELYKLLTPYVAYIHAAKGPASHDFRVMLFEICEQARQMALLFRSAKTQYLWLQVDYVGIQLNDSHVEILGSTGHDNLAAAGKDYYTVFGAIAKGGGVSGRVRDEMNLVRKAELLLGPLQA